MKVADYKGFQIHVPTSGGKAGKGCNATSSLQVIKHSQIRKLFRFKLDARDSYSNALEKAKAFIDGEASKP